MDVGFGVDEAGRSSDSSHCRLARVAGGGVRPADDDTIHRQIDKNGDGS